MRGWIVPPPKAPTKTATDYARERERKVRGLESRGLLKSPRIKAALLKVPREEFIPRDYRDYAYCEVPLPLPGAAATISCPHSYPLFYEPLGLDRGHRFLEVGTGSGYGAAVAREVVGDEGLVVSIELDALTYDFAKRNLQRAGYSNILLVLGDGGLGYPAAAPYDRIAITAACPRIPAPLIEQLTTGGRAIAPLLEDDRQVLTLITKQPEGVRRETICDVLYVALRGEYGTEAPATAFPPDDAMAAD
ncbi:MAG: protein-L-isoaspartate O-methyltransferase [Betaproteobacteria bacterium]|nr:protein-L-isoaspartate O-methyltransferase [Betaproteobacteria bacterium]